MLISIQQSFIKSLIFLGAIAASGCAFAAGKDSAANTVEKLHSSLLEVMQNANELGFSGRVEFLYGICRDF